MSEESQYIFDWVASILVGAAFLSVGIMLFIASYNDLKESKKKKAQ